jgi:ribosomal protein S12 methylthiotransferase
MRQLATLVSLGCAKNLVDSEVMAAQLLKLGFIMTSDPSSASLLIVNTCGFLESAVEEAIQEILKLAEHKSSSKDKRLIVTGCMVQRYGKKLLELLPEVDLFLGTSHYHELEGILRTPWKTSSGKLRIAPPRAMMTSETPRVRSDTAGSAYLKIAEGCSNQCSFCLIPRLRGPYRSRAVDDVLAEAARLASEGVKEINLIAQDTTAFGLDRGDETALVRLLEALDSQDGLQWIRLMYAYPDRVDEPLLRTMAQSSKVLPYLDIPIQHSVPRILRAMRREGSHSDMEELIGLMRSHVPEMVLRTSIIVGFPSETEADFESLLRFVERVEFDHLGVFAYSQEAGSRAARLPNQVDDETKERRRQMLLEVQQDISRRKMERYVGSVQEVLVEGCHPETELLLLGRMASQAPEVDGSVIIVSGEGLPGRIMRARITGAHDYDVEAELLCPMQPRSD